MAVTTNIYPPIVDTFMPAFLIDSDSERKNICRVYFSLSLFNTTSQIKNCQVTVRNQSTNQSALNPDKYPSEVMITDLKTDLTKVTDDKYYIDIKPSDMVNEDFIIDQYYKVQIRFTDLDAEDPPITEDSQPIDEWLADNLMHFSEWSTVCLVRGISVPKLALQDYESGSITDIYNTIANVQVLGELTFANEDETETLRSYNVVLYDNDDNKLIDSGEIYTSNFSNVNEINYPLNYSFEVDNTYYFKVTYTTQNLYTETVTFYVYVLQAETKDLKTVVRAWADEENGRIALKLDRSRAYGSFTGQIILRRTDSKSNFTVWEDLHVQAYNAAPYIQLIWYDYTIESGIWYKYGVQGVDESGARTPMVTFREPVMLLLDHMFLTAEDRQLKIKYNPQVSSFKKVVSESKTDTIGSKYPYIRRNADVYYSSFPISGIIAAAMDEDGIFTTKEELYGDTEGYYEEYNENNNISAHQDFIYERFFREKVEEFLYADGAKLFRSPSEGNILVRLMDINLTPNQQLGRRIWSFTATAYEIDECTVDNYDAYGIYTRNSAVIGTTSDGSALMPIRRIVFIDDASEFPVIGKEHIVYIYDTQIYIWDEEKRVYKLVSVPTWNTEHGNIDPSTAIGSQNELFTDGESLYQWNSISEDYDIISEPIYNQETVEGE